MDRMSGGDAGARLSAAAAVSTRVLALALAGTSGDPIHYGARPRTLKVPPLPESVLRRECATTDSIVARGGGGEPARRERPTRARQPEAAPVAGPATVTGSAGGLREKGSMPSPSPTRSAAPQRAPRACAAIRNPYLLRIAWPVYHQDQLPRSSWRVVGGGEETDGEEAGAPAVSGPAVSAPAASSPAAARLTSRISGAVVGEFQEERGAILARTILRGVAKAAVTRTIEKAPGEDASGLGSLLGVLVNVGTALLEQADTRSWHLLPDRIGLVRVQLPPGEHELALEVGGAGGATRRVELGTVRVRAGGLNFVSARIWP
jgi:hypothetical protein